MVSLALWIWVPLKVVGHTLVSSNKRMSVEKSVEKRMSLAFLYSLLFAFTAFLLVLSFFCRRTPHGFILFIKQLMNLMNAHSFSEKTLHNMP